VTHKHPIVNGQTQRPLRIHGRSKLLEKEFYNFHLLLVSTRVETLPIDIHGGYSQAFLLGFLAFALYFSMVEFRDLHSGLSSPSDSMFDPISPATYTLFSSNIFRATFFLPSPSSHGKCAGLFSNVDLSF